MSDAQLCERCGAFGDMPHGWVDLVGQTCDNRHGETGGRANVTRSLTHPDRLTDSEGSMELRPPCSVSGCERPRVRNGKNKDGTYSYYRLCSAHRSRKARKGDVASQRPIRAHRTGPWRNSNGYLEIAATGHPTAMANGHAKQHRVVLFDAIGDGEHRCHWCGTSVTWEILHPRKGALTVDHLDGDRTNNALSNLVPSCHPCNAARAVRTA